MGIVLNEYEWAERAIADHELGKKPVETLNRVARYYAENQYSKKKIRELLDAFMTQCDPQVSLVQWSDTLDKVARSAGKYQLARLDGVDVSKREMEHIEGLDGKQVRRLAFVLLCTAKYWDAVSEKNNHWVNTPDKEIMQMANINTSIKRQSLMFSQLRDAGFIRFSKKIDNLNVQVVFMEPSEVAIHIHDFRNLGYQYLKYYGGPYFECANCGITTRYSNPNNKNSRCKQKYCKSCAVEVDIRQSVNSVMRARGKLG